MGSTPTRSRFCATPEDACKLVLKDGTVVACNPNPQVIPEPRAKAPLALQPTPIEVVNLDLSPYAIPEVARSRSRSPIREDPFADFEDVLGRLSKGAAGVDLKAAVPLLSDPSPRPPE